MPCLTSNQNRLLRATAFALALLAAVGCKNEMKTQKAVATQEWNGARAAVLFSLANDQYKTGNLETSRKSIDEALALDPKNPNILLMSARLDVEQGKLERAQDTLKQAQAIDGKNADMDYLLGVINQRWQRIQQAHDCYAQAVEKKPDDLAYLLAQAEMLVELRREEDAIKLLSDRVIYFEHSGAIRDALAQLLEQRGDLPKAIDYYRQASVLEMDDDAIRERLGLALYRSGQWSDALSQLTRLLKKEANAGRTDLMVAAAECELALGKSFEARERFERASYAQASNVGAWQGAAKASIRLGDLRRAELAASKAVALAPTDAQTHLLLGLVRMKQRQLEPAMASFRRASELDPRDPVSLCMMGMLLEQGGELDDAIALYGKAATLSPKDELAGRLLAEATQRVR
ncbi:MAG: tetratricopeptide repeat protein [Tepidisphaeraceae bacterium]